MSDLSSSSRSCMWVDQATPVGPCQVFLWSRSSPSDQIIMHREIEGVLGQWIVAQVAKALLVIVAALVVADTLLASHQEMTG